MQNRPKEFQRDQFIIFGDILFTDLNNIVLRKKRLKLHESLKFKIISLFTVVRISKNSCQVDLKLSRNNLLNILFQTI